MPPYIIKTMFRICSLFLLICLELVLWACSDGGSSTTTDTGNEATNTEVETETDTSTDTLTDFSIIQGKAGSQFSPVWNDEFNGPEVDTTKWRVANEYPEMNLPYRRNWKPKNVYIENGVLIIRTTLEADGSYSSGAVRSGNYFPIDDWEFGQAFGRFEARIISPTQQGHWSAFWLTTPGMGGIDGTGQDGTEIDIVEFAYVQTDQVNHALHWDGYGDELRSSVEYVTGFGVNDRQWHTYTLEWYPDEYIFYIDGTETWRTSAGGVSQVPQHIRLTEEIGNYGIGPTAWGTGPIEEATLPDYTRIDYVRVWEYQPY